MCLSETLASIGGAFGQLLTSAKMIKLRECRWGFSGSGIDIFGAQTIFALAILLAHFSTTKNWTHKLRAILNFTTILYTCFSGTF